MLRVSLMLLASANALPGCRIEDMECRHGQMEHVAHAGPDPE